MSDIKLLDIFHASGVLDIKDGLINIVNISSGDRVELKHNTNILSTQNIISIYSQGGALLARMTNENAIILLLNNLIDAGKTLYAIVNFVNVKYHWIEMDMTIYMEEK